MSQFEEMVILFNRTGINYEVDDNPAFDNINSGPKIQTINVDKRIVIKDKDGDEGIFCFSRKGKFLGYNIFLNH